MLRQLSFFILMNCLKMIQLEQIRETLWISLRLILQMPLMQFSPTLYLLERSKHFFMFSCAILNSLFVIYFLVSPHYIIIMDEILKQLEKENQFKSQIYTFFNPRFHTNLHQSRSIIFAFTEFMNISLQKLFLHFSSQQPATSKYLRICQVLNQFWILIFPFIQQFISGVSTKIIKLRDRQFEQFNKINGFGIVQLYKSLFKQHADLTKQKYFLFGKSKIKMIGAQQFFQIGAAIIRLWSQIANKISLNLIPNLLKIIVIRFIEFYSKLIGLYRSNTYKLAQGQLIIMSLSLVNLYAYWIHSFYKFFIDFYEDKDVFLDEVVNKIFQIVLDGDYTQQLYRKYDSGQKSALQYRNQALSLIQNFRQKVASNATFAQNQKRFIKIKEGQIQNILTSIKNIKIQSQAQKKKYLDKLQKLRVIFDVNFENKQRNQLYASILTLQNLFQQKIPIPSKFKEDIVIFDKNYAIDHTVVYDQWKLNFPGLVNIMKGKLNFIKYEQQKVDLSKFVPSEVQLQNSRYLTRFIFQTNEKDKQNIDERAKQMLELLKPYSDDKLGLLQTYGKIWQPWNFPQFIQEHESQDINLLNPLTGIFTYDYQWKLWLQMDQIYIRAEEIMNQLQNFHNTTQGTEKYSYYKFSHFIQTYFPTAFISPLFPKTSGNFYAALSEALSLQFIDVIKGEPVGIANDGFQHALNAMYLKFTTYDTKYIESNGKQGNKNAVKQYIISFCQKFQLKFDQNLKLKRKENPEKKNVDNSIKIFQIEQEKNKEIKQLRQQLQQKRVQNLQLWQDRNLYMTKKSDIQARQKTIFAQTLEQLKKIGLNLESSKQQEKKILGKTLQILSMKKGARIQDVIEKTLMAIVDPKGALKQVEEMLDKKSNFLTNFQYAVKNPNLQQIVFSIKQFLDSQNFIKLLSHQIKRNQSISRSLISRLSNLKLQGAKNEQKYIITTQIAHLSKQRQLLRQELRDYVEPIIVFLKQIGIGGSKLYNNWLNSKSLSNKSPQIIQIFKNIQDQPVKKSKPQGNQLFFAKMKQELGKKRVKTMKFLKQIQQQSTVKQVLQEEKNLIQKANIQGKQLKQILISDLISTRMEMQKQNALKQVSKQVHEQVSCIWKRFFQNVYLGLGNVQRLLSFSQKFITFTKSNMNLVDKSGLKKLFQKMTKFIVNYQGNVKALRDQYLQGFRQCTARMQRQQMKKRIFSSLDQYQQSQTQMIFQYLQNIF